MSTTMRQIIEEWLDHEDRTQAQLSRMAGISEAQLSRVMKGKQHPSERMLRKLQRAMALESGTLEALQAKADAAVGGPDAT